LSQTTTNVHLHVVGQAGAASFVTVATFDVAPAANSVNILYHDTDTNVDKTGTV
jgi:hypothetical protein